MKVVVYTLLILLAGFFLFPLFIGANPFLTLQSINNTFQPKQESISIPTLEPTPIATEQKIDDMAHRYFDNHIEMKWKDDQFDKGELTSDAARQTMRDCIATFGNLKDCEDVIEQKFWIGMSDEWAIKSLGNPDDVNSTVSSNLRSEQWVYGNPLYGATYLYFDNGILKSYQKN